MGLSLLCAAFWVRCLIRAWEKDEIADGVNRLVLQADS